MRRILTWLIVITLTIVLYYIYVYSPEQPESVHYHAGFVVYIDGVKQDYKDFKYMNFTPCSEHETKKSKAEELIELAHLHDGVGDVVHVHRTGAVWGDLFRNIGVSLPGESPILKESIEPNSSVVITVGTPVENPEKVSTERIKEVEAKSELCSS